jgi:hypothetical protein
MIEIALTRAQVRELAKHFRYVRIGRRGAALLSQPWKVAIYETKDREPASLMRVELLSPEQALAVQQAIQRHRVPYGHGIPSRHP